MDISSRNGTERPHLGSPSRSLFQRITRCTSVSVVTTVISVLTLATATAAFGMTAWIANVIATTLATGPSYYLNRRWTWGKTDASDPWREVLPFWILSFTGLALSTIAVGVVDAWTAGAHLAPPVHTMTLLFAHLSGFGILWVAQFVLLDRVLFGRDAHSPRPEVTEAPPTGAILALRRAQRGPGQLETPEYRESGNGSVWI